MNRRRLLSSSLALLSLSGPAFADAPSAPLLFPEGPLSTNKLAKSFHTFPSSIKAPPTKLMTDHGLRRLADLRGKVRIVTLWAEWCAPCIAELQDFSRLHQRFGDAEFEVVAILTGSTKKLSLSDAKALLASHQAALPLWAESNGGATLLNTVAVTPAGGGNLPCTLLVDRQGVIRGRAFGAAPASSVEMKDGFLTEAAKAGMMAGNIHTAWATPAADAFVAALKAGALS